MDGNGWQRMTLGDANRMESMFASQGQRSRGSILLEAFTHTHPANVLSCFLWLVCVAGVWVRTLLLKRMLRLIQSHFNWLLLCMASTDKKTKELRNLSGHAWAVNDDFVRFARLHSHNMWTMNKFLYNILFCDVMVHYVRVNALALSRVPHNFYSNIGRSMPKQSTLAFQSLLWALRPNVVRKLWRDCLRLHRSEAERSVSG